MATRDGNSFGKMARTYPFRTALFTLGPVVLGLAQFVNGYLNDGSLLVAATLLALMTAFAVLVTRYHLATFRIQSLTDDLGRHSKE